MLVWCIFLCVVGLLSLLMMRSAIPGFSPNALGQPGTAVIDEQSLRAEHIHQYVSLTQNHTQKV